MLRLTLTYPQRRLSHRMPSALFCCLGLLAVFLPTMLLPARPATAAVEEPSTFIVRATGYHEATGFAARRQAIAEACREAVLEVLANYLPQTERYMLEDMLRNPEAYIQRFDLLRHDQDENGSRVEVDVHILEQPLFRDLARVMLPRLPELPNVLIVMGERIGPDRIVAVPDFGVAEMALREAFEENDLPVSGVDSIDDVYSQADLIALVNGDLEVGAAFARENLADVVIVGTAVAQPDNPEQTEQLQRHEAIVQARVYRGFDGKIMEEVQSNAVVHGVDLMTVGVQAVEDACAKLVDSLQTAAIIAMLGVQEQDKVLIHIQNPGSELRVDQVAEVLRHLPGVEQVERVFFSEPLARLYVAYHGSLRQLVEAITTPRYDDTPLEIHSAVGREVTVAFPDVQP